MVWQINLVVFHPAEFENVKINCYQEFVFEQHVRANFHFKQISIRGFVHTITILHIFRSTLLTKKQTLVEMDC